MSKDGPIDEPATVVLVPGVSPACPGLSTPRADTTAAQHDGDIFIPKVSTDSVCPQYDPFTALAPVEKSDVVYCVHSKPQRSVRTWKQGHWAQGHTPGLLSECPPADMKRKTPPTLIVCGVRISPRRGAARWSLGDMAICTYVRRHLAVTRPLSCLPAVPWPRER